jgi:hypothetical protein
MTMRIFILACALLMAACSTTDEYRRNSFKPKDGPACPSGQHAICDMHMGKAVRCDCVADGEPLFGDQDEWETEE